MYRTSIHAVRQYITIGRSLILLVCFKVGWFYTNCSQGQSLFCYYRWESAFSYHIELLFNDAIGGFDVTDNYRGVKLTAYFQLTN
jgi:hypothetical protein